MIILQWILHRILDLLFGKPDMHDLDSVSYTHRSPTKREAK